MGLLMVAPASNVNYTVSHPLSERLDLFNAHLVAFHLWQGLRSRKPISFNARDSEYAICNLHSAVLDCIEDCQKLCRQIYKVKIFRS